MDFYQFFDEVDVVVNYGEARSYPAELDKLKAKVVLDCHNICPLEGVYYI